MPLQQTSGNVTADAYGGGVAAEPNYIESVFSTYLYTGNSSTQTITNGIDLAGKGGLVWYKDRTTAYEHEWVDTARGAGYNLESPNTSASTSRPTALTAFTSTGFTLGSNVAANGSGDNFVSWTFRKQPKFFDVVTWTGNGAATQTISHNLGSVPGCIIAKVTSTTGNWFVYHRATSATPLQDYTRLNLTNATNASGSDLWGATSTTITVDSGLNLTTSGATYVAYLFAHDAGGFGLTGTDNVISCGTFTTDAGSGGIGNATVTLGYEPQWVLIKNVTSTQAWYLLDTMRGWVNGATANSSDDKPLFANLSNAEATDYHGYPTATGFVAAESASNTYIYIAIRRGPMKVPTSGTSVFATQSTQGPSSGVGTATNPNFTSNFPIDMFIRGYKPGGATNVFPMVLDRLRGGTVRIMTSSAVAESASNFQFDSQIGVWYLNLASDTNNNAWMFRRAPGFFDEVCYSGTSANRTVAHNLGVAPELILIKIRNEASGWRAYASPLTATSYLIPNQTNSSSTDSTVWNNTTPTASVFSLGTDANVNGPYNYVAYLFATCPGVSKVGSYTGTGSTQTISCGFTGGARFVLIKRTDSTGDWFVWDTARGMVAGTDPRLPLNSTAAESNANWVYTTTGGFQIVTSDANVNASGGSYIYLAIA